MATFSDNFEDDVIKVAKINQLCSESACACRDGQRGCSGFREIALRITQPMFNLFDHLVLLIRLRDKHTD